MIDSHDQNWEIVDAWHFGNVAGAQIRLSYFTYARYDPFWVCVEGSGYVTVIIDSGNGPYDFIEIT